MSSTSNKSQEEITTYRDSSPRNKNAVLIYAPLFHSKPLRYSFISCWVECCMFFVAWFFTLKVKVDQWLSRQISWCEQQTKVFECEHNKIWFTNHHQLQIAMYYWLSALLMLNLSCHILPCHILIYANINEIWKRIMTLWHEKEIIHEYLNCFYLVIFNQNVITQSYIKTDFTNHSVHLNIAHHPTASLHYDRPPSNQQPLDSTKYPSYYFFLFW